MAEEEMSSAKRTDDPDFKPGVMSPSSKRTFSELQQTPFVPATRQKLVLDENMFEESFLRCMVCRDLYNMVDKTPRLLPCHHAFCFSCIMTFFDKEAEYRASMSMAPSSTSSFAVSISCPHCKATFITTEEGLRQLTTDHRIVQLMDFVGHTDRQTVEYCQNHTMQPLNFFCEKCDKAICRDCTVLDHKTCSQEKLVMDITGAIEKYKPALEEGKNNLSGEIEALKERKSECEKALESTSKGDDSLSKQIKETFEKLRKALADREQELLDIAAAGQGNTTQTVEEKIKNLDTKQKEVSDILRDISKADASGTVQDLFAVYKQVKNYKTEPGLDTSSTERKDSTTSTFNARDESTLVARISNFGDIQTTARTSNGYGSGGGTTYSSSNSGYSSGSSYLGSTRYGGYSSGSSYTSRYTPTRSYKY